MTLPFSILDLAPIAEGSSIANALENSRLLAIQAEKSSYKRVWLAEHHGMFGVASSATAIVISHIAAATSKIRVGSGGIMLPNHSPLVIAEQFGTLATLYPDRVDLGLGRAPGTDLATARALRRHLATEVDNYPEDIRELQHYLSPPKAGQNTVAVPGADTQVPIWLLGSSLYSAKLAGEFGLPYSFASHFAPEQLMDAISLYRSSFKASEQSQKPHISAGLMAVVADSDAEAQYLFTSVQQQFMNLRRGVNRPFARPIDDINSICTATDQAMLANILRYALVGSKQTVTDKLSQFIESTQVDEIIVSMPIHDINARLKSVQLLAETGLMKLD